MTRSVNICFLWVFVLKRGPSLSLYPRVAIALAFDLLFCFLSQTVGRVWVHRWSSESGKFVQFVQPKKKKQNTTSITRDSRESSPSARRTLSGSSCWVACWAVHVELFLLSVESGKPVKVKSIATGIDRATNEHQMGIKREAELTVTHSTERLHSVCLWRESVSLEWLYKSDSLCLSAACPNLL